MDAKLFEETKLMMTNYEQKKKYEFQRSGIERIEMMICMLHNSECKVI